MQQTETIEKVAGIGAVSLWATLHGWLGWLAILYAVCIMLDCVTGTQGTAGVVAQRQLSYYDLRRCIAGCDDRTAGGSRPWAGTAVLL